ncbi:MAG: stage III sporulation protein AA [Syntrophomonadaceae bacterium]|jgi:stage III sporulation protein AA
MYMFGKELFRREILPYFTSAVKELLLNLGEDSCQQLEEIRLRCGQPLLLKLGDRDFTLDRQARLTEEITLGYRVVEDDLYRTIASISDNSLYAFEEEIRRGFITVTGGHRVGLAGQVVLQGESIKTIKDFSSLCFRIARQVKDCALPLLPRIRGAKGCVIENALIISPPRCGKTTILRDLARLLSQGSKWLPPYNVSVVDERSELAGCFQGIPQLDVGPRTDVLDACPKAKGMVMALRSLSPQVIITDEIGRKEDVEAIQECVNAGIAVISSVHASTIDELHKRPIMQELLASNSFKMAVILSRVNGPGHINEIIRWG